MFKKLLGERNWFFKNFLPIIASWAVLSGLFGFLFILARAKFISSSEQDMFMISWLIGIVIAAIVGILTHGGFRILFGLNIERKYALNLNLFVINNHIDPEIRNDDLVKTFYELKSVGFNAFISTTILGSLVVLASSFIMMYSGISIENLVTIIIGGFFAVVILDLFTIFSSERFLAQFLQDCRKLISHRRIEAREDMKLANFEHRFYYFIALFFLLTGILLSFIPNPILYLLGLIIVSFVMVVVIAQILFSSIFFVFQEIRDFSSTIPKEDRAEYFTGSPYKEVLELSKDLTVSAGKVHEARVIERKAREDLKELDEAKTQFILATEHHLRTPLTISKGYLNNLLTEKDSVLSEKQRLYVEKINNATNRVTDLVNELLEISQMEVGKSILKMESVNIKDLITDVVNNVKSDIDVKKIKPVFYFPGENNILSLNKEKITEALSNIISNAVKYNKMEGELKVSGKIITNSDNKKFYQLTIEDQGIGIKPENLSKIFTQYFERGEEARKVYATGRGIGLVISKNIIKAHQGTIRAESEGEGKGSKFVVELPI
jgi:signal transduction histidine kinase